MGLMHRWRASGQGHTGASVRQGCTLVFSLSIFSIVPIIIEENKSYPIFFLPFSYLILALFSYSCSCVEMMSCMRNHVYFFLINFFTISPNYLNNTFVNSMDTILLEKLGLV